MKISSSSATIGVVTASTAIAALLVRRHLKASEKRKIVISGGCGNLGRKLAAHLSETRGDSVELVLLEHPEFCNKKVLPSNSALVPMDLCDENCVDALNAVLHGADAVVHFSAVNPYPNADWGESAASMDHALRVLVGAAAARVRRVVLASSNHVMGGYKDLPEVEFVKPTLPPRCGTRTANEDLSGDAIAYAAAKLAAERVAATVAASIGSPTSFVTLRIGWCQPGINSPTTLSAAGSPPEFLNSGDASVATADDRTALDEAWFKGMWLSNGDFLRYFTAALFDANVPPGASVTVNAMSNNTGMRWCLDDSKRVLGVSAVDDVTPANW